MLAYGFRITLWDQANAVERRMTQIGLFYELDRGLDVGQTEVSAKAAAKRARTFSDGEIESLHSNWSPVMSRRFAAIQVRGARCISTRHFCSPGWRSTVVDTKTGLQELCSHMGCNRSVSPLPDW